MNENIDLVKILKNCPSGTTFWSKLHGEVTFKGIDEDNIYFPIRILYRTYKGYAHVCGFSKEGFYSIDFSGECLLVPSKEQQDWEKFKVPQLKKPKFDPKTLKPFDKVIIRKAYVLYWSCDLFSYNYIDFNGDNKSVCIGDNYCYCIPYNDETKHLVGTKDEAPDYYKYWED